MRNTGPLKVTKLHPLFGAEIEGTDITRPLSAREFGPIRAAFEEHSVLLFRDQHMNDEQQVQFSEYFGPLETTGSANPAAGTQFQRQSNLDIMTGEPIPPDDMRMIYQKANYFWHSDSSFKRIPSLCSILT
ncbi:MAG: TauD/TfdA dioxygenase family protein, partial [Rhodospirillaceae bacterium]